MAKHQIDIDEDALARARAVLGTDSIQDTVNEALRRSAADRDRRVATALDILAKSDLADRSNAWG